MRPGEIIRLSKFENVGVNLRVGFVVKDRKQVAVFLMLGHELKDGSQPLDVDSVLKDLGYAPAELNLETFIDEVRPFSEATFGPGMKTETILDHIEKEMVEVRAKPCDLEEWIDIILLAIDGAWRCGFSAKQICQALWAKLRKNKLRKWPDWRTLDPDKAIEHIRE
jgi:hypothetical protein